MNSQHDLVLTFFKTCGTSYVEKLESTVRICSGYFCFHCPIAEPQHEPSICQLRGFNTPIGGGGTISKELFSKIQSDHPELFI